MYQQTKYCLSILEINSFRKKCLKQSFCHITHKSIICYYTGSCVKAVQLLVQEIASFTQFNTAISLFVLEFSAQNALSYTEGLLLGTTKPYKANYYNSGSQKKCAHRQHAF